jgi:steroid 5-alpha reductase family enzyme
MRKHIIRTIMIKEANAAVFHGKLTEVINDAQDHAFQVDVQYSTALLPQVSAMHTSSNHPVFLSDYIMHMALVLVYDYV